MKNIIVSLILISIIFSTNYTTFTASAEIDQNYLTAEDFLENN